LNTLICVAQDEPVSALFATAPNIDEARRIAQELLQQRLVACVNLVPQVESMYVWEGKLETSQEVLMMIKVRR
jgi:periplasmic divalent cation tolerance protein